LTLQINLVVSAVACIIVGVLSDKYGRRRMLLCAFVVYVVGAAMATTSSGIVELIVARTLMGIGQGSAVLAQVITRDLFEDPQTRLNVVAVLGSLQPIVVVTAPMIGGFIGSSMGWRWVFRVQTIWGALVAAGAMVMPETKGADACSGDKNTENVVMTRSLGEASQTLLSGAATRLLGSRLYVGAVGIVGIMFATISSMLTLLPFVLQQYCQVSETLTGGLIGTPPVFIMAGSMLAMCLSKHFDPVTVLRIVNIPFFFISALTAVAAFCYQDSSYLHVPPRSFWPILLPCFLMVTVNGVFMPVCQTLYLHAFKDIAGVAAGFSGLTQNVMMAFGSAIASAAWDGTPRSFYGVLAALMFCAQAWFWCLLGVRPPADAPTLEPGSARSASREASANWDLSHALLEDEVQPLVSTPRRILVI